MMNDEVWCSWEWNGETYGKICTKNAHWTLPFMNSNYSCFFSSGDPPQSNSMMLWYTYLTFFIRASLNSPLIFFVFFLLKQNYKIIFLTTNLYKLDGDDFLKMIYIKHVLWLWSLSILCKLDQLSFHAFLM